MTELLVSGEILLASADAPPLANGAVLIAGGAIAEVGDRRALRRDHPRVEEVGGDGMLVLPGLVNAHHHGMGISTVQLGFPDPGPPDPGLRDTPFESWMGTMLALDAIDPYLGTLCKDVLLIESGVTAHLHMHFPSGSGDGRPEDAYAGELRETLRAHRASGQRVALAPHWSDRSRLAYDGDDAFIASLPGELRERARRLSASRMPSDAYVASIREIVARAQRRAAAERATRDHGAAVGERRARGGCRLGCRRARRGRSPARAREPAAASVGRCASPAVESSSGLRDAGVLAERSALAHGVWLRDSDIDLLARTGATVVHNCSSNLRLATGIAPVRQLVAAGVSVALGLDDMGLADDDDMFAELRVAHVMQRVHGEPQHPRLDPARLFGLAWEGARASSAPRSAIGRLEPGRRGDVVVLDLRALRAPFAAGDVDIWDLLVSRARASHVDSVIVDGRPLMLAAQAPAHRPRRADAGGRRGCRVGLGTTASRRARLARAAQAPDRRALPGADLARLAVMCARAH